VLTSTSTRDEIIAAYRNNASYEEANDSVKAAAFITACRFMLLQLPTSSISPGGARTDYNMTLIRQEMEQARAWLRFSGTASMATTVIHSMDDNFRGLDG